MCEGGPVVAGGEATVPLPGDGEERSHQLPPVGLGVHVHAEVHGSLQRSGQGLRQGSGVADDA